MIFSKPSKRDDLNSDSSISFDYFLHVEVNNRVLSEILFFTGAIPS